MFLVEGENLSRVLGVDDIIIATGCENIFQKPDIGGFVINNQDQEFLGIGPVVMVGFRL